MRTIIRKLLLVTGATMALSASAHAAVSFTSVPFDAYAPLLPPAASGETLVTDFNTTDLGDNPVVASGFTLTESGAVGLYVPPLVSGIAAPVPTDTTQYMAVLTGGQATLKTQNGVFTSLSVLLGSLDTYNQLTFRNASGGVVATYDGYDLHPPADGDQFAEATNREFYFTMTDRDRVTEVDFNSYGNSFEFDNIAATAVPEPSTWLLLIGGFALVGWSMRRKSTGHFAAA